MEARRRWAYRRLLYGAMLNIRVPDRGKLWNPAFWLKLRRQRAADAALADWFHNLAMYSADDFVGFNEDAFWARGRLVRRKHELGFNYEQLFENELERFDAMREGRPD